MKSQLKFEEIYNTIAEMVNCVNVTRNVWLMISVDVKTGFVLQFFKT